MIATPARVFAALYDRAMAASEEAGLRAMRAALLADARGTVVEIGAGTGANLGLYGPGVERLVACEPEGPMADRLRAGAAGAHEGERSGARDGAPDVEVREAPADRLPFADATFDEAVSTLVLCTVPDAAAALAELRRVLRPGGRLRLLEHVRADDDGLARWQRRLTPVQRVVARGCHLDRDTEAAVRAAGFSVEGLERDRMPKAVPLVRPLLRGVAVAP